MNNKGYQTLSTSDNKKETGSDVILNDLDTLINSLDKQQDNILNLERTFDLLLARYFNDLEKNPSNSNKINQKYAQELNAALQAITSADKNDVSLKPILTELDTMLRHMSTRETEDIFNPMISNSQEQSPLLKSAYLDKLTPIFKKIEGLGQQFPNVELNFKRLIDVLSTQVRQYFSEIQAINADIPAINQKYNETYAKILKSIVDKGTKEKEPIEMMAKLNQLMQLELQPVLNELFTTRSTQDINTVASARFKVRAQSTLKQFDTVRESLASIQSNLRNSLESLRQLDQEYTKALAVSEPDFEVLNRTYTTKLDDIIRDTTTKHKSQPAIVNQITPMLERMRHQYQQMPKAHIVNDTDTQSETSTLSRSSHSSGKQSSKTSRTSRSYARHKEQMTMTRREALEALQLSGHPDPKQIDIAYKRLWEQHAPFNGGNPRKYAKLYGARRFLEHEHRQLVDNLSTIFTKTTEQYATAMQTILEDNPRHREQLAGFGAELIALGKRYINKLKEPKADRQGLEKQYYADYDQVMKKASSQLSAGSSWVNYSPIVRSLYADVVAASQLPVLGQATSMQIDIHPIESFKEKFEDYLKDIVELQKKYPAYDKSFGRLTDGLRALSLEYFQMLERKTSALTSSEMQDIPITEITEQQYLDRFKSVLEAAKTEFAKEPGIWANIHPILKFLAVAAIVPALVILALETKEDRNRIFTSKPVDIMKQWERWEMDMLPTYEVSQSFTPKQ